MAKVFKFGGASIKDIENIKNVGGILQNHASEELVIVFSAMGKVTNMLEQVVEAYVQNSTDATKALQKVKDFHVEIINALFVKEHAIFNEVNNLFVEIEWVLEEDPNQDYAYDYDQIVSIGEFLSTRIMSAYLSQIGFENTWLDARDLIRTDNSYRNAKVDWETTTTFIKNTIKDKHSITQGFIGCTSENFTSTLGREGSDFSAAILAYCLDAKEVVIWKDVPGMMNADPKHFVDAQLLNKVSFDEAIELAFFGAKVIHPKTIQPLKKKNISLQIKSFLNPDNEGSLIENGVENNISIPSFIVKENQILISISDENLAFIVEAHMSQIFSILAKHRVGVNLMQNSAISFMICVDNDLHKIPQLIENLKAFFKVLCNENLSLFTIRHYTDESVQLFLQDKEVVLEQKSNDTIQLISH
ncbi:MAG: aspartate kinase [Thalassomonas sp.]|jgi:aspartate kinase